MTMYKAIKEVFRNFKLLSYTPCYLVTLQLNYSSIRRMSKSLREKKDRFLNNQLFIDVK